MPLAQARRQFDTNLFGLARLTQLVIPGMRQAGGGTIINLSSVFGRFAVRGNAYYAATKHAVAALTDAGTGRHPQQVTGFWKRIASFVMRA